MILDDDEDRDEDLDDLDVDLSEDEDEGKKADKVEKPAKPDEDDGDDEPEVEGEDDERLSADMRHDESDEERRERRRNEKKQKKQNRRNYERSERVLIASISDELRKTKEQLAAIQGKVAQDDAAAIAQQAEYWQRQVIRLNRIRGKAVQEGDGETFARAEHDLQDALARANHYNQLKSAPVKPEGQEQTADVGPIVRDLAMQFAQRNRWYDGENQASQLVMRLDAAMMRQGWDPTTPEYWEALENEAYKRLPPEYQKYRDADDDEPDDEPEEKPQPRDRTGKFKGPPAGGKTATRGSGESKPGTVRISKEFKETLIQAGLWDDKAARNRAIKEHLRLRKELNVR
jgi:hypothetical protein